MIITHVWSETGHRVTLSKRSAELLGAATPESLKQAHSELETGDLPRSPLAALLDKLGRQLDILDLDAAVKASKAKQRIRLSRQVSLFEEPT